MNGPRKPIGFLWATSMHTWQNKEEPSQAVKVSEHNSEPKQMKRVERI